MSELPLDAATVLQALELPLEHEPVDADQVIEGSPTTGVAALTEVDEVFIVLKGRAILRRDDGSETELVAGSVGRLEDGEETEWEVHETLRKIYIA